jgi:hypothetical protein
VEQKREPMNKNRIRGIRRRASWQLTTKPISIKGAGCKSGGGALKAVEFTSGDLLLVAESRLKEERSDLKEVAEVSRGHSSHESDEGPNGPPQGG